MRIPAITALLFLAGSAALADGARQKSEIIIPEGREQRYETRGYAPAIRTEDGTIYVSGVIARLKGEGSYDEQYAQGLRDAFAAIDTVLKAGGSSLDDVVELMTFHTDIARQVNTAIEVRMEVMNPPHPAWTAVGTNALASPFGVTEIRVVAKTPKE